MSTTAKVVLLFIKLWYVVTITNMDKQIAWPENCMRHSYMRILSVIGNGSDHAVTIETV